MVTVWIAEPLGDVPDTVCTDTPSTIVVTGGFVGGWGVGGAVVLVTLVAARLTASTPPRSWMALTSSPPVGSV